MDAFRQRLLWKLLLINIVPVIGVIIIVVWLAIDNLSADYFMALMRKYHVSTADTHRMFLSAIHRYLIWAALAALCLALLLSYLLTRRILRPLFQMAAITREFSAGNYSKRVDIVSRDEIGDVAADFNRMADSLETVEKLRKNMVADVAHELRTPLTNLRGYIEALSDGVIPPKKETFAMLEQEILRLVHLVENLQQLARADAARAYLDRREVSLYDLILQVLELYRPDFSEKTITVRTELPDDTGLVVADRDRILQALRNLTENACKYTPRHGDVTVSAEPSAGGIRVVFANSGEGIAADDLPFIFERFYRGDKSRSREMGGAGIGLSIVKELIEAHGGSVGAESGPGETRIWFTLPV